LRNGLALAAFMNVSTLSNVFAKSLLSSNHLPWLVKLNSARLAEAYRTLTGFFDHSGVYYLPCNAGHFILAKLAPKAKSWDDEALIVDKLSQAGVLVSPGRSYHVADKGWARVSFAVSTPRLIEATRRMAIVLARALT